MQGSVIKMNNIRKDQNMTTTFQAVGHLNVIKKREIIQETNNEE